ncbi:CDP-alcohol phosphatidyltransferase family protein [Sandaracinobacteroides sp. A072]|uniref:CDP-alcohol phosphatidyltransferase family protein n=1 Tax=Sandaracinobacteroides sp. A072 TaxID=3461146 RepID=UPI004041ACC7
MDSARPVEIEPLSNRHFVHPAAAALLPPAIRLGLHPNTVSVAGLLLGLLAGLAYTRWEDPRFATLGFLLMIGWHILDGLDGKLARATGKTSPFGRFLDGIADYACFVSVYCALAFSQPQPWAAFALAVVAGVAHALQSQFYEGERATYIRRIRGIFHAEARTTAGGGPEKLYNRLEALLANRTRPFDRALATATEEERAAMLAGWQPQAARTLRRMALISANGRTLAIWVAAMLGYPVAYWIWEIVCLSLLALAGARALRQAERR